MFFNVVAGWLIYDRTLDGEDVQPFLKCVIQLTEEISKSLSEIKGNLFMSGALIARRMVASLSPSSSKSMPLGIAESHVKLYGPSSSLSRHISSEKSIALFFFFFTGLVIGEADDLNLSCLF